MPQAKRASSTTRSRPASFKQPAALKRLTTSLDAAQKALTELSRSGGRDVSKSSKDITTDLRKFLSNARQHSNKLGKALQSDFEKAQKDLAKAASSASSGRSSSSRSTSRRSTSSRSSSSRSASGRSTAKRGSSTKSRATSSGSSKS